MDEELLEKSIIDVEKSLEVSRDNLKKAQHHIDEGELILALFKEQLKLFR